MKQKLLTLMTLLLCAVSGAWAEDLCSAQVANGKTGTFSNTTGEAATNCTLYYSGLQGGSNAVTIGGIDYYKFGSDGAYIQLKYSGGNFIAGDVVSVMVVSNSGSKSFNLKFGKTNSSNFSCNATSATAITYTLTADDIESDGSVKIYRGSSSASNIRANVVSVTGTRKSIATQVFYGVKKGSTTLTETTDYIVDGSIITLTEAHKALSAPTDIKLIKRITYTDSTTEDQDVDVTFDGTKVAGYFVSGATTIGETDYTVRVLVNETPTLEADKSSLTITSTKAAAATQTIKLTGANLTGAASVAFASEVDGLTISPATFTVSAGAVNQEFTVTYHSMAAVASTKVNLTFTVGAKSVVIPVTYSSTAADVTTITDVTAATTWDWKDTSKDVNSPANGFEIPVANASDLTGFPTGFDYEALAANAQYFARKSEKCFQGITLKFHTTKAGHITVVFSNTGGNRPYRHLFVNGVDTGKKSNTSNANDVTAENIYVEAGDVELKGMMEDGDNNPTTPNMLRIYKVVFVPSDPAPSVNISDKEWATYVTETAIDFTSQTNVEAFIVTGHEGTAITKTKVTSVPANTPVLLHALNGGGSYYSFDTRATSSTDVSGNKLKKGANGIAPESGKTKYVLSVDGEGNAAFKRITASADIPATKAYLQFDETIEAPLFDLDGETTSIKAVETKTVENGEYINLAGQRVAQPTKGLYIVNGKKVIIK